MPKKPLTEEQRQQRNAYMRAYTAQRKTTDSPEEKERKAAVRRESERSRHAADREKYNRKQQERRAADRERFRETNRRWYSRHREDAYLASLAAGKRYRIRLKLTVLRVYGGIDPVCVCCGESILEFLSLDHIEGGGNQHRKSISAATSQRSMYEWAKKNGYPPLFQVLCFNCNMAKGFYGECPHNGASRFDETFI